MFALSVMLFMVLLSFVANMSRLTNYKIRLQTAVDMAAYNAAAIMAYYMSNDSPDEDSVAEINREIMIDFVKFREGVTLANCSKIPTEHGPRENCYPGMMLEMSECDAAPGIGPPCTHPGVGSRASESIDAYYDDYLARTEKRHEKIYYLMLNAYKNAITSAKKTIEANLPNVDVENELITIANPLKFIQESENIIPSFYCPEIQAGWQTEYNCFCTLSSSPDPTFMAMPYDEKIGSVNRRLIFDRTNSSGYFLVGVVQSAHDPVFDPSTKEKPAPFDYMNFSSAFGRHDFPAMQAWAAAAPYRDWNEVTNSSDTPIRDPYLKEYIQRTVDVIRNWHHDHKRYHEYWSSLNNLHGDYYAEGPPDETDYAPDALFYPNPKYRVRFIPLAGGEGPYGLGLYGKDSSANPFELFGLSEILFGNDAYVNHLASSGVNAQNAYKALFRH
ncbi:MAG: hypothetical protein ABIA04_11930 [Pseudomonadota bacterium]